MGFSLLGSLMRERTGCICAQTPQEGGVREQFKIKDASKKGCPAFSPPGWIYPADQHVCVFISEHGNEIGEVGIPQAEVLKMGPASQCWHRSWRPEDLCSNMEKFKGRCSR